MKLKSFVLFLLCASTTLAQNKKQEKIPHKKKNNNPHQNNKKNPYKNNKNKNFNKNSY